MKWVSDLKCFGHCLHSFSSFAMLYSHLQMHTEEKQVFHLNVVCTWSLGSSWQSLWPSGCCRRPGQPGGAAWKALCPPHWSPDCSLHPGTSSTGCWGSSWCPPTLFEEGMRRRDESAVEESKKRVRKWFKKDIWNTQKKQRASERLNKVITMLNTDCCVVY